MKTNKVKSLSYHIHIIYISYGVNVIFYEELYLNLIKMVFTIQTNSDFIKF